MKIFKNNKKNNDFKAKEIRKKLIFASIKNEDEILR